MPLNPSSSVPQIMKTSIVKIYAYKDKNPAGFIINPFFSKPVYFDNLVQFLMLMDEIQESIKYPKASMEARSFTGDSRFCFEHADAPSREELLDSQPLASFKLSVYFRHNASWQGNITWLEQSSEVQFRSVLELIKLIDSVLSA